MEIEKIRELYNRMCIKWSNHAAQRMLERSITRNEVISAIQTGEVIEEYPNDYPFPSYLILGIQDLPVHVVVAPTEEEMKCVYFAVGTR